VERSIKLERLFSLGNYKNIRLDDGIDNIPQNMWTNKEVMENLTYLVMLSIELSFRRYLKLSEHIQDMSIEDQITYLDKVKSDTYELIKQLTNGETKNE
jgi:hypothetical protein